MKLQMPNFQPVQWFSFARFSSFFCLLAVFCGLTNLHAVELSELPLDVVITGAEVDPFIEGYHDVETFQIVPERPALKATPKTALLRSKNPFTQVAAAPKAIQKIDKNKSKGPQLFLAPVSENQKSTTTKAFPSEGWRQSKISAKAIHKKDCYGLKKTSNPNTALAGCAIGGFTSCAKNPCRTSSRTRDSENNAAALYSLGVVSS